MDGPLGEVVRDVVASSRRDTELVTDTTAAEIAVVADPDASQSIGPGLTQVQLV